MDLIADLYLEDEAATVELGAKIATCVAEGDILCLKGGLGAGKTTFARGFVRAALSAAGDIEIPSPTFTLVQAYETGAFTIWHFDFYRIESPQDVYELGIEEAFDTGVSLIEWPERAQEVLPPGCLSLHFLPENSGRRIRIAGDHDWADRLKNAQITA